MEPHATRIRHVIAALYKPTAIRQVIAVSRRIAEKLPPLSTVAVISITSNDQPEPELPGFQYLLRLVFDDVDFLAPGYYTQQNHASFTAAHSEKIHEFVRSLPTNIRSIVVHCGGGYSRSAAVALGLHEAYGYAAELERLREANLSIWSMLVGKARPKT